MQDDVNYAQNDSPILQQQSTPQLHTLSGLEFFIDLLKKYNEKLPAARKRSEEDYQYLRNFFSRILNDQDKRAQEIASDEYKQTVSIALSHFPYKTYFLMCAGGRNDPLYTNGITYGIMERVRIPERFLKEFVRDLNGNLTLLEHSSISEIIESAFEKTTTAIFIVDSHVGCKARMIEEVERGENPQDAGLHTDITQKNEMIDAMKRYIHEHYESKQGIFIQTSFNPISGFMYMGLETQNALVYATGIARGKAEIHGKNPEQTKAEYAEDVIEFLISRNVVLSAATLVKEPEIINLLSQAYFEIDWKKNYAKSARLFWDRIAEMKDSIIPYIKSHLASIYPEDNENMNNLRSILVLSNALNGYLHTPTQIETEHNEKENERNYANEYSSHREEGIILAQTNFPPHDIAMVIIPDGKNINSGVDWGARIVRKNKLRTENPIADSTYTYKTHEDYIKAPLPIVVQGIVSDSQLSESDWEAIETIDWNDLPGTNWNTITDKQFLTYLEGKKDRLPLSIANGIMDLRRRMKKFYTPGHSLYLDITEQTKVVLPILTDASGRVRGIIPFVKFGN